MSRYPLFQHAYFVNDLSESARSWAAATGAGPFFMTRHHVTDWFSYRGDDSDGAEADVSYGFGYLGDLMIQLIQQHDDKPSIYRDMYAQGEEGFHHMAFLVPAAEYGAERQRLLDLGYAMGTELKAGGVNACYLDAREATGGFLELHDDPARIPIQFEEWRQAHLNWDGVDPVVERSDGTANR